MSAVNPKIELKPIGYRQFSSNKIVTSGANDNSSAEVIIKYVEDMRTYGGADYVPAYAKAWWLP